MNYVFTEKSLQACLENVPDGKWYGTLDVPNDGSWDILRVVENGNTFIIHREDVVSTPRIVIIGRGDTVFGPAPEAAWATMAYRILFIAESVRHLPVRLPISWNEYHVGNLIAFFATQRIFGAYRWVVEIKANNKEDICFWELTETDKKVELEDFQPDYDTLRRITSKWKTAFKSVQAAFKGIPRVAVSEPVQVSFDLDATTFGAVTRHRTYSTWLEHLTPKQRDFVEDKAPHSVKLRGPAGSGKTLTLELKALRELYRAKDSGEELRILFATHSWAVAQQVDAALRAMDEKGDFQSIAVFPLLEIAKDGLPATRTAVGYRFLGEDSLSGKQLQLERIAAILDDLAQGDWLTFRAQASEQFSLRVESPLGSAERNALVWDLMTEFACVLSAQGILPGINAERRYLALQRLPWMMPLETDADKRFVLEIYSTYVTALKTEGLMTSDQLVNDYLNYLETFTWNLERGDKGYDLIFVDELHLFNEQERLVLNYLTRSPEEYPKIFMALDPRQSASEIYFDLPTSEVINENGDSGTADEELGEVTTVDLSTVHRFTPEILGLIRHIHRSYPALDLGRDWDSDMDSIETTVASGPRPGVVRLETREEEITKAFESVSQLARAAGPRETCAIILLDTLALPRFAATPELSHGGFFVIRSRDEVDTLRYRKRSIVLSTAEFVGGLQFDYVIVAGFPSIPEGLANLGYQRRRFLSLLYLAVSRATKYVGLLVNDEAGGIPEILESAIRNEFVSDSG